MGRLNEYYDMKLDRMKPMSGKQLFQPGVATQKGQPGGQTPGTVQPQVDTSNAIGSLAGLMGPTPAEREARERRAQEQKSKMMAWTGLFDGLRQLGNLYYTTKGAAPQKSAYNPYAHVEQEYQQQRQIADAVDNYRRQYAQGMYSLRRQMEQDKRTGEEHQAKLDWYRNRDEQNAEKVAIQRFRAEVDAAYKGATLEQKERMNDIMADVYAGRISLMDAQRHLANVRAANVGNGGGGGGRNNGTYGYKTTRHVDPATGDIITERVPTTGVSVQNPVQPSKVVTPKKQPKQTSAAPRARAKRNANGLINTGVNWK